MCKVSIILPTHNRLSYLDLTITTLIHQTAGEDDYEILIVDNASTDNIREWFHSRPRPANVKYFYLDKANMCAARNYGATVAMSDILIFSDPECILHPQFVQDHLSLHQSQPGALVNGWTDVCHTFVDETTKLHKLARLPAAKSVEELVPKERPSFYQLVTPKELERDFDALSPWVDHQANKRFTEILQRYGLYASRSSSVPWAITHGANISTTRKLFDEVGGFDEEMTLFDDWDFSYRLYRAGAVILNAANARNFHQTHPRDYQDERMRFISNYERLVKKFSCLEIQLIWPYYQKIISFHQWNDLVAKLDSADHQNTSGQAKQAVENLVRLIYEEQTGVNPQKGFRV